MQWSIYLGTEEVNHVLQGMVVTIIAYNAKIVMSIQDNEQTENSIKYSHTKTQMNYPNSYNGIPDFVSS